MSRFTVSVGDEDIDAAIPAIIATTTTPTITSLFNNQRNSNWLKKLIPNCARTFVGTDLQILQLQYQLDMSHRQHLMSVCQDVFQIFRVNQISDHIFHNKL